MNAYKPLLVPRRNPTFGRQQMISMIDRCELEQLVKTKEKELFDQLQAIYEMRREI